MNGKASTWFLSCTERENLATEVRAGITGTRTAGPGDPGWAAPTTNQ
ncbi:hypothetical protein SB659_00865 [Arthrobacter sp. SIMBA_036]